MKNNLYLTNLPNLLEIQRSSFCWFMSEGLPEQLAKFSSIIDLTKAFELKLYGQEYQLKCPKITSSEVKDTDHSYNLKLFFPVELIDLEEPESMLNSLQIHYNGIVILKKKKILIGEIPLMTNKATFLINGCERVVINQLVRSPGVYFRRKRQKNSLPSQFLFDYSATIIPNQGSWLSFELQNKKFLLYVKIDKKYEIPINWFLMALELTNEEIYRTIQNITTLKSLITNVENKINLEREKHYKKKDGSKGKKIKKFSIKDYEEEKLEQKSAIAKVQKLIQLKILNSNSYDLGRVGRLKINTKLKLNLPLSETNLSSYDFLKTIDYLLDVYLDNAQVDDIDSLKNRRIRPVGELLQIQVRISFTRLQKTLSEKLATCDLLSVTHSALVNSRLLTSTIKDFFCSSQLSQFMDETNPLSEIVHKRKVSALGPGALNSDHVTFAARDIHPTQYGRLCPIDTPEGQNTGLVTALASHVKVNEYGFLKTPFFKMKKGIMKHQQIPIYLTAEEEDSYKIAAADIDIYDSKYKRGGLISIRYKQEFLLVKLEEIDLIAISPIQFFSIGTSLIPFLEHDDANRILMGSSMQKQSVPLLYPNKPIIGTGLEWQIPFDSGVLIINSKLGRVINLTGNKIVVESMSLLSSIDKIKEHVSDFYYNTYYLEKYRRSNQDTCINHKPIVWLGEIVKEGQVLADGPATESGELALGQNLTIAYLPWEGYNYEDALILSERLVYENIFTSIHIEKHEIEIQPSGPSGNGTENTERMTKDIPSINPSYLKYLDSNGIVSKGTFVESGDILVGKVVSISESQLTPEQRLLRAIFRDKTPPVQDTSFRVPHRSSGRVIEIIISSKEKNYLLFDRIFMITIFIAHLKRVKIGDKIAGRHGNKGIVSKILPIEDMPYLQDGTIVDIILNPLGVPSRMNVGQIFECLLGLAATYLDCRFKILPFDEFYGIETSRTLINNKLKEAAKVKNKAWLFNTYSPGKVDLTDGRTGEFFDNPILVGKAYILKLIHLVDDKIHARSTGNYSLVTQQPLRGRSKGGGQRFGEMEVWALEAFGAAYTLQELLTIKSDDMEGRNELLKAIVLGTNLPKPSIPESFRVLLRELNALGLDITTNRISTINKNELNANLNSIEVNVFQSQAQFDFEESKKESQVKQSKDLNFKPKQNKDQNFKPKQSKDRNINRSKAKLL